MTMVNSIEGSGTSSTTEPADTESLLRDKIKHVLKIYPKLSPSMLQVGIGTAMPPAFWQPVLEIMIAEGEIVREIVSARTPADRQQSYTVLSLSED